MSGRIVLSETTPLRFWGVETGSRVSVLRLDDGGLLVHSPIPLSPDLRARVDALGPVVAIVAPSRFHHLSVGAWAAAWPDAVVCGCPGVAARRPDLRWDHTLGDTPHPRWAGQVEQVHFAARTLEDEVVFFDPESRTLLCADAVFNLASHPDRLTRAAAWALGNHQPGATWLERLLIRDRRAARTQIDHMLAWAPERILLAHGAPVETDATAVLREAYAWL